MGDLFRLLGGRGVCDGCGGQRGGVRLRGGFFGGLVVGGLGVMMLLMMMGDAFFCFGVCVFSGGGDGIFFCDTLLF